MASESTGKKQAKFTRESLLTFLNMGKANRFSPTVMSTKENSKMGRQLARGCTSGRMVSHMKASS